MWEFLKFVSNAVVPSIITAATEGSNGLVIVWQNVTVMFTNSNGITAINKNTPVDALVSTDHPLWQQWLDSH